MRYRDIVTTLVLVVLSFLVRWIILLHSDNFLGAIATARVAAALSIIDDPQLRVNFDGNTSVLYEYMLAAVLRFYPEPLVAPRIFTMIFGVLLVVPFYFILKLLFDRKIALYAGILLSLFPVHAIQSVLSTCDAVFYFFFFCCLYYFFKFSEGGGRTIDLFVATFFFNIGALLRFESWLFAPLLAILLYNKKKWYSIGFFLLCLITPLIWLYLCNRYNHNYFYSFVASATTAHSEILLKRVPYTKNILAWVGVLYKSLGSTVFILAIGGMAYAIVKKRSLYLMILFLCLYSFLTLNILLERMWLHERYSILLGLFLLPYSALLIETTLTYAKPRSFIVFSPILLLVMLQFGHMAITRLPRTPEGIKEIAGWLKNNVSAHDKIIVGPDAFDVTQFDIVIYSTLHPKRFAIYGTPLAFTEQTKVQRITDYLLKTRPRYLVMNSTGFLLHDLGIDMTNRSFEWLGYRFEQVYEKDMLPGLGIYKIYRILH